MARRLLIVASLFVAALVWTGCGSEGIDVSKSSPERKGAVLFAERCGACHTLTPAGTQGSATNVGDRENVDGPNFDTRVEKVDDVIYAIENGGFSGKIMPQNIVTGEDAKAVAAFLAHYAGQDVEDVPSLQPETSGGTVTEPANP